MKVECPTEDNARELARMIADASNVSTGYSGRHVTTDADAATVAACQAQLAARNPYAWSERERVCAIEALTRYAVAPDTRKAAAKVAADLADRLGVSRSVVSQG